jgi:hypothetical protein
MSNFMKRNEGMADRAARIVLGLGLLATTAIGPETQWGWIGIVPLVTGLAGTCPIYSLLGISTCTLDKKTRAS